MRPPAMSGETQEYLRTGAFCLMRRPFFFFTPRIPSAMRESFLNRTTTLWLLGKGISFVSLESFASARVLFVTG